MCCVGRQGILSAHSDAQQRVSPFGGRNRDRQSGPAATLRSSSRIGNRPHYLRIRKSAQEETLTDNIKIFKVPVRNKNIHHSSNRELIAYFIRGSFLALKLYRERRYDLCFAWSAVPAGAIAFLLWRLFKLRYLVRVCGPDIPGFERRYRAIYALLCPVIRAIWRGAERVVAKSDVELEMIRI